MKSPPAAPRSSTDPLRICFHSPSMETGQIRNGPKPASPAPPPPAASTNSLHPANGVRDRVNQSLSAWSLTAAVASQRTTLCLGPWRRLLMSCTLTSRTRSLTHALTRASKLARRSKQARTHAWAGGRTCCSGRGSIPPVGRSAPSCASARAAPLPLVIRHIPGGVLPASACKGVRATWVGVWGLGFGVGGFGFGLRVLGIGLWGLGLGWVFRGLGVRVSGLGFEV